MFIINYLFVFRGTSPSKPHKIFQVGAFVEILQRKNSNLTLIDPFPIN